MRTEPNSFEITESKEHILNTLLLAIAGASSNPQKILEDLNAECERLRLLADKGHQVEFAAKHSIEALRKFSKDLAAKVG